MTNLLEVRDLKKYFRTPRGMLHAVDGVSMSIKKGATLGIVGESGCGKSTLGRTLIHLHSMTSGQIIFDGRDISSPTRAEIKKLRTQMQIIFQDPYSSLNPRMTVQKVIIEPIKLHRRMSKQEMLKECDRLMELVGIDSRLLLSYPHELDGGRRQRVGIARALALNPKFIVCDEPVSALDVSIQAQILNLLMDLQEELGLTYIFITHNLSVVRHISDHISVMYLGELVEICATDDLFDRPLHPYTQALISAIPSMDIDNKSKRIVMKGELKSPIDPEPKCRYAARCLYAQEQCLAPQTLEEIAPGHFVACCRAREVNAMR
jgi:oligopeptide/dipeptide ABC transporter ATP-binding protein